MGSEKWAKARLCQALEALGRSLHFILSVVGNNQRILTRGVNKYAFVFSKDHSVARRIDWRKAAENGSREN